MRALNFFFSRAGGLRWTAGAIVALMGHAAPVGLPAHSSGASEPPPLGATGCPWPDLSGQRLLDHQLGNISFSNESVRDVVEGLIRGYGVPLSFIEASPATRITLALPSCTLGQLLDQIVAKAAAYRYAFVGSHLVLYSRDSKWQARIDDLNLPAGPRFDVIYDLVTHLRRAVPSLEKLGVPSISGNPDAFIFQDPVKVSGPATVVELLTQVLGQRPSAVFEVPISGGSAPGIVRVHIVNHIEKLDVESPRTTLQQKGEFVQLRVTGVLRDGTRQDLTSSRCGTRYTASSEAARVSIDGLVTAAAAGHGGIVATYDNLAKGIGIDVVLPGAAKGSR